KMSGKVFWLAGMFLALSSLMQAAPSDEETIQVKEFTNLNVGDSFVNVTNDGSTITFAALDITTVMATGNICVNVYTFDPAEELVSCCSCMLTPNALQSLSVRNDLISNTLTPATPSSVVVKLLSTAPLVNYNTGAQSCNPGRPEGAVITGYLTLNLFNNSLHAWGTTLHALSTSPGTYHTTETPFSRGELGAEEFTNITRYCAFIQASGSGFGICKSCRTGGL